MDVKDMKQRLLNLEAVFSEKETLLTDLDRAIGDACIMVSICCVDLKV